MTARAFYNELSPDKAAWLRALVAAGEIAPGDVSETPIQELRPDDLAGYTQVHLFAGIGGWSLALRLAGWPDDRPIWTGSAPCQPFSQAGRGDGVADPRHLWPHMRRLLAECRPQCCAGEQVASPAGRAWLAGVHRDLEALGYRVGAAGAPAGAVGAPHPRARLYWVADTRASQREARSRGPEREAQALVQVRPDAARHCERESLALPDCPRPQQTGSGQQGPRPAGRREVRGPGLPGERCGAGAVGHPDRDGRDAATVHAGQGAAGGPALGAPWSGAVVLDLRGGTRRRASAEPGAYPLAHGIPRRLGSVLAGMGVMDRRAGTALRNAARRNRRTRLIGYGEAIVSQVGAAFIRAYLDVLVSAG